MTCPQPRKEQEQDLFCAHGYTISALEIISSKERDKLEALLPSPDGESSDVVLPEACHELGRNCLCGHLLLSCRTSLDWRCCQGTPGQQQWPDPDTSAHEHVPGRWGRNQPHGTLLSASSVLWEQPWECDGRIKAVGPAGVREPLPTSSYWCFMVCTQLCKLWPEHFN